MPQVEGRIGKGGGSLGGFEDSRRFFGEAECKQPLAGQPVCCSFAQRGEELVRRITAGSLCHLPQIAQGDVARLSERMHRLVRIGPVATVEAGSEANGT